MKKTWDKLWIELSDFHEQLDHFMAVVPQSLELHKKKMALKKKWDKVKSSISAIDSFITPIESITVAIPDCFNNEKFIERWQFFKDYMEEQHGIKIKSRRELTILKRLITESEKNAEKAIEYINISMDKGWRNVYKSTMDNIKPDKADNYDPDLDRNK